MSDIRSLSPHYDVVVVGARVAGAVTAMLLARAGMRVLAVDRQGYGSDTLSTHALMRPAVMQLARWGVLDRLIESRTPVITTTTFHYEGREVPVAIRPEPGIPGLIAPRRTVLDRTLVDAASAAGATIVHDVSVRGLLVDERSRVCGVELRDDNGQARVVSARHVVGADGLGSTVARQTQARVKVRGRSSVAHIYGYSPVSSLGGYHWYFAPGLAGAVIPTNDGLSCVVVSVPTTRFDAEFRFNLAATRLAALDKLAREVAVHAAAGSPVRAFRGTPGLLRQGYGPGWLLVGDAGFFRDPLTSHGISDAMRDAEGVASALLADSEAAMRRFEDERDAFALPILEATEAISSFEWAIEELPERHKRFSDVLKAETALLAARSACDRVAPLSHAAHPPSRRSLRAPAMHA
ncbi:FAD-dependent monooxygenase [Pseudaminobacter sp. 19-2017]|uniref:FAD-dependent monooxygenase n=1 Tax=Pseudaminobacter soli (ex Zhang et al. 2022) TaxID=2831468 RepID=A0A942DYF7_9HYPH|nr:FAD-dependent monooxygenase [Pseudaminobacter soli]MBS3647305.1 FAD-dependent monooxygenase [Pseudaminobacter soli]